ncbi:MAG: HEAT repeat domain-containing protein, partial [candidate division Zixibacteria bacterium]
QSSKEREVDYALGMLTEVKNVNLIEPLKPLLKHPSANVRRKTIHVLVAQQDASLVPDVKELLDDDDVEVCRNAMYFLFRNATGDQRNMLNVFLSHPEPRYRYAALSSIAMYGTPEERSLIDERVVESLINLKGSDGSLARQQIAGALGHLANPNFNRYIKRLLNDTDPEVVSQAIWSVGRLRERDFVPWLLHALADKRHRQDVREALASFGTSVLGTLLDYMADERVDYSVRRNIPRVLSLIPQQDTVDALTVSINRVDQYLKYYVVKALNRLRTNYPDLKFDESRVDEALMVETKGYYEIVKLISLQKADSSDDASRLLAKALSEKQDQNLERIFRILGLSYPPNDIYNAYQGVVSNIQSQRASAIEFLDNLLKSNIKRYLLPILDEASIERIVRKGQELFDIEMSTFDEALLYLINGRDAWLKACAIYATPETMSSEVRQAVENAANDLEQVINQTAELVLRRKNKVN